MTKDELTTLIETGREIEFTYNGKDYSITYYNDNRKNYISFCEFYQDVLDVSNVNELRDSIYHNFEISAILLSLKDEDISIF